MRPHAALLAVALTGCTSTVLTEPIVHVSPYLALYRLRGDTKMQSEQPPGSGVIADNAALPLSSFGHDRTREDVGVRVDIGDGFGGLRADYYKLDMNTARSGVLTQDWGDLLTADLASIRAEMDELRLGYVEPLADTTVPWRGEDLQLRLGAGGVFATRRMKMRGREATNVATQDLEFSGDQVYAAVRAQATWQDITLDLDYAVSPESFVIGGDVEDLSQDFEARVSYQLPHRDIRFFAGWRYSELAASGSAEGLAGSYRFENDLVIDGIQLGVVVTF